MIYNLGKSNGRPLIKIVTESSYIIDNILAMYDGIENSGYGVHNDNATVWKNLAGGGYDGDIGSSVIVESNALKFDGVRSSQSCVNIGKGYFGKTI